ncbi:UNVERIFIED_CONTAM: hypothetical protein Sradi_1648300 [Sesamum radiatum]|uniref:Uncharacterized protein n=1 Tax=Sesamum radiatum TaxID=300843 RepID=A0AAW2UEY7_SESRA
MARVDEIIKSIIDELGKLPPGYPNPPRIFKDNLRSAVERDNVYDPEIVGIGLYNHKKDYLKDMQIYKLIYLKRFLDRKYMIDQPDNNVNDVLMKESAKSTNNVAASVEESVGRHPCFPFNVPKAKNGEPKTAGNIVSTIDNEARAKESVGCHPYFPFYITKGKKVVEEIAGSSMEEIADCNVKEIADSSVNVEEHVGSNVEEIASNSVNVEEHVSSSMKEIAGSSVNVEEHVKEIANSSVNVVVCENEYVYKIVNAVVCMEERARKWYGGRVDPANGSDFVKMLVIDGCFLIELLRCYGLDNRRNPNDPIFKYERILSQLRHDIVLNDNQIPFFVLNDLFNMSQSKDPKDDLIHLTLRFVEGMFLDLSIPKNLKFVKPDHLLGLIRDVWVLPFANNNVERNNQVVLGKWKNINSASELQKTGIDFKISEDYNSLMDIKFVRKCLGAKLKIPQMNIYYETESQIRNLVAYEQYLPDGNPRYVSDYTFFMHCLINTSNDVELLCRSGIIGNWLGNDEEVSLMFNRLGKTILTSSKFSYSQIFSEVNIHYHSHRKKWWAELWREYFDGPWACAKFLAALVLLGLAILQTIFTIYPYYHPRKDSS